MNKSAQKTKATVPAADRPAQAADRPTIGLLIGESSSAWAMDVLSGLADAAVALDVNLMIFVGGQLSADGAGAQGLYELISDEILDGLILTGNVLYAQPLAMLRAFRERHALPMVGLVMMTEALPTVVSDGFSGMYAAVDHLIAEHGYREIAFIRGPEGPQSEADDRYRAYVQALEDHELPLDPDLVMSGDYSLEAGGRAARALLDQGKAFRALVAANDVMALGAMNMLQDRGVRVPEDVALVGFDDFVDVRYLNVPLTTVRQPIQETAREAVKLLLRVLRGEAAPSQVLVPTELIVRSSCGCLPLASYRADCDVLPAPGTPVSADALDQMPPPAAVPEAVWRALLDDLAVSGSQEGDRFLRALDLELRRAYDAEEPLVVWQDTLSALRQHLLAWVDDPEVMRCAEDLFQQARILVSDFVRRAEAQHRRALNQQAWRTQQLDVALSSALHVAELADVLADQLSFVRLPRCYVAMYQGDRGLSNRAHLLLSYDTAQEPPAVVDVSDASFAAASLLPPGGLPDTRYTFVVLPLSVPDRQLGYVLIEVDARSKLWGFYLHLAQRLSGVLFRMTLMRDQEAARQQVEEAGRKAEVALRDALVAQHRYVQETWQAWAETARGYVYTDEGRQSVDAETWLPVMTEAVRQADMVMAEDPAPSLSVPLTLYGDEVVGALGFQGKGDEPWSEAQLTLVRAVAEEMALALENQRLLSDVRRRASRLLTAAEVSRAATSIVSLDELLPEAVNLIRERFDLYYAGIFLVDENERWAALRAGTGEAGRQMLERGHKLEVGGQSMIGACVADGQARITFDVETEAVHSKNPLLPETRSELALPLSSRGRVIGAMTVQDVRPGAFTEDDITILQTMADQLGNAIENARLLQQMEQNLRELEIASGRYTRESWESFAARADRPLGYRYRLVDVEPATELSDEARAALEQRAPVVKAVDAGGEGDAAEAQTVLGVPIRLRNEVLGVLDLRFEGGRVPQETVEMVTQIADRLGLSLESARLLQESLRSAERERVNAQAASDMRQFLGVDAVLRNATRAVREALDLHRVTLRLATQRAPSDEV